MNINDPAGSYLARLSTPAARATMRSALNVVARALGHSDHRDIDWSCIDYSDVAHVRASLNRVSPAWGRTVWTALRQTLAEGERLGVVAPALVASAKALPAPRGGGGRRGRRVDTGDVAALLAAAAAQPETCRRRDLATVAVLAGGGLRRAEAAALTVGDWDEAGSVLTVRSGKGRRLRRVPLPGWAATAIDDQVAGRAATERLLQQVDRWGNAGGALSGAAIEQILDRLAAVAGIEPCGCHPLRAHAVTEVIALGDVGLAQRFAGHADVSTTLRCYDTRGFDDLVRLTARRQDPLGAP